MSVTAAELAGVGDVPDRRGVAAIRWMLALYLVAVAVATVQRGVLGTENNFAIFRWAFLHLVDGQDLYAAYPGQHDDLFKYSPTFAFLFAPFVPWPFAIGLTLWNATNAVGVWYAVTRLLPPRAAAWALGLAFIEILTNVQRAQSNALCAAAIILAFVALERGHLWRAAIAIGVGAFVKLFPLAALAFAVWERRVLRFAAIVAVVLTTLAALPATVAGTSQLAAQYASWRAIEAHDADDLQFDCLQCPETRVDGAGLYGGVMQQLRFWAGAPVPNWPVQLAGTLLLLLPLAARWRQRDDPAFRRRFLSSLLVYVVIFNHQSESPSFVIAMLGVAIWWADSARTRWQTAILLFVVLGVSVAYSDLVPGVLRVELARYRVKTVPCLVAWLAMQWELWRGAPTLRPHSAQAVTV